MSDKQSKMLERVRALIAKAEATEFPEEAEAFRAKADTLMTAYAIEQWQVDEAQEGVNARPKPERRDFSVEWWYKTDHRDDLWQLFHSLARHCRCVVVWQKWANKACPVVGLPSDLDYLDLLFTSLMLDLASKVDPQPNPRLDRMENLVMLKEAGLSWPEIARKMVKAGLVEGSDGWQETDHYGRILRTTQQPAFIKARDQMTRDYRAWCKQTGHKQSYNNHKTYRRNFAAGYCDGIDDQLMRQRRNDSSDGAALVLRDISKNVQEEVWNLWGDLRPHEPGCECDRCKARRKPVRYARDTRKQDWAARDAGQQAGREANIQVHQGRRVGGRKQLEG